jgi:hypothetical protein
VSAKSTKGKGLRAAILLVAAAALALAAGAFFLLRPPPKPAAVLPPPRFHWQAGRAYTFASNVYTSQAAASGDGQSIAGELSLRGNLVVRCHEASDGKFVLGLAFGDVERARLAVAGNVADLDAGELRDEVLIEANDRGRIARILLPRRASDGAKAVMQTVATALGASFPDEPAAVWEVQEPALLGRATSRYAVDAASPRRVARRHKEYATLLGLSSPSLAKTARVDSSDVLQLDGESALEELHVHERLQVPNAFKAVVSVELVRTGEADFARAPLAMAEFEARRPNEMPAPANAEQQTLEQLAGGLTMERLASTLRLHAQGAKLPPGFVVSATALLKLHPEKAKELVPLFEEKGAGPETRALVCDLLASAGHAEAQAALRDALSTKVARRDPAELGALLQRLSLITEPDDRTLAFVAARYSGENSPKARLAAAYVLGATIGSAARTGSARDTVALDERLRRDLDRAGSEEEKVTLLAALGNAGLREDIEAIRAHAKDESAAVRRQVALSLRKTDWPEAADTLFDLLADKEPQVGLAAVQSLGEHRVGAADVERMTDLVKEGKLAGELGEPLISLVGEHPEHGAQGRLFLQALLARTQDPHTQARIRMLLGA